MSPDRLQESRSSICTPCRGTGRLTSGLGGTPHEVVCPWCKGTGEFIPGLDAQQAPAEAGAPVSGGAASEQDAPDEGGTTPDADPQE